MGGKTEISTDKLIHNVAFGLKKSSIFKEEIFLLISPIDILKIVFLDFYQILSLTES